MGELIEHSDNGDGNIEVIRVGDAGSPVSLKVYQDVYHQVTGRTEQIRKRYSDHLLVEFSEIEQLHIKIQQLCDMHKIVACNEVISVFHEKERKEQFMHNRGQVLTQRHHLVAVMSCLSTNNQVRTRLFQAAIGSKRCICASTSDSSFAASSVS